VVVAGHVLQRGIPGEGAIIREGNVREEVLRPQGAECVYTRTFCSVFVQHFHSFTALKVGRSFAQTEALNVNVNPTIDACREEYRVSDARDDVLREF